MELHFNPEHIRRANELSMTGRAGDIIASDAHAMLGRFAAELPPADTLEEAQRAYYDQRATKWAALVQEAFSDALRRRSEFVPWYIAGRSNYPAEKANRQIDRNTRAHEEYERKMEAFIKHTRKELARLESPARQIERYRRGQTSEAVQMGDPYAVEKLAARLEYLKEQQDRMRRVNAYYRKNGTCAGCEGITEKCAATLDEAARTTHGVPYVPFEFSCNLQNLHRVENRLRDLMAMKQRAAQQEPPQAEESALPFRVVENADAARLQILFDDIPPAEARELLKANGFRWSPRNSAWQRQLTPNAHAALRRILPELTEIMRTEE